MTMMTPLGQGGRMYPRHRRWPKVVFVIVVVLAVIGGIGFGVWTWLDGRETSDGPTATPSPSCSTPKAKSPKNIPPPSQINVDVRNDIGNTSKPVKSGAALVRYPEKGLGSAVRVAAYIENAELVEVKGKPSKPVGVWLGPDFDRVLPPGEADVENVDLPAKRPVCK